jgi:hypothetical protein
MPISIYADKC